jgi:hypothetical protein
MPLKKKTLFAGEQAYNPVFQGRVDHTAQIRINVTALTNAEIDADGYLKPGVPFAADGTSVGVGEAVFGVTIEPIKVADGNAAGDIAAADATFEIALGIEGVVNRHLIEANLGRVLTADELAGFALAPCKITLLA